MWVSGIVNFMNCNDGNNYMSIPTTDSGWLVMINRINSRCTNDGDDWITNNTFVRHFDWKHEVWNHRLDWGQRPVAQFWQTQWLKFEVEVDQRAEREPPKAGDGKQVTVCALFIVPYRSSSASERITSDWSSFNFETSRKGSHAWSDPQISFAQRAASYRALAISV